MLFVNKSAANSESYKMTMATSCFARLTMRASLRSMSSKRSACAIWTSSALPTHFPATKQLSIVSLLLIKHRTVFRLYFVHVLKVSQVKWTQPTRLYSAANLTKADVDSRVLMVCKAFDKITADKVDQFEFVGFT